MPRTSHMKVWLQLCRGLLLNKNYFQKWTLMSPPVCISAFNMATLLFVGSFQLNNGHCQSSRCRMIQNHDLLYMCKNDTILIFCLWYITASVYIYQVSSVCFWHSINISLYGYRYCCLSLWTRNWPITLELRGLYWKWILSSQLQSYWDPILLQLFWCWCYLPFM